MSKQLFRSTNLKLIRNIYIKACSGMPMIKQGKSLGKFLREIPYDYQ